MIVMMDDIIQAYTLQSPTIVQFKLYNATLADTIKMRIAGMKLALSGVWMMDSIKATKSKMNPRKAIFVCFAIMKFLFFSGMSLYFYTII
jgi:hypothetical protein